MHIWTFPCFEETAYITVSAPVTIFRGKNTFFSPKKIPPSMLYDNFIQRCRNAVSFADICAFVCTVLYRVAPLINGGSHILFLCLGKRGRGGGEVGVGPVGGANGVSRNKKMEITYYTLCTGAFLYVLFVPETYILHLSESCTFLN